jgi:replicative DNA helicase
MKDNLTTKEDLIKKESEIILASLVGDVEGQQILEEMITEDHNFFPVNIPFVKLAELQILDEEGGANLSEKEMFKKAEISIGDLKKFVGSNEWGSARSNYDFLIENSAYYQKKELVEELGLRLARGSGTPKDIEKFEDQYFTIKKPRKRKSLLQIYADFEEELKAYEEGRLSLITTGIPQLDEKIIGIRPEDIFILGGFSGIGKTHLMVQLAISFLKQGKKVLFITTEMSEMEILIRFGSHIAQVLEGSVNNLEEFKASREKLRKSIKDFAKMYSGQLEILRQTNFETVLKIMKMSARHKMTDIVLIDYLQDMDTTEHYPDERYRLSFMCTNFKNFAKEFRVPLVINSQITEGATETYKGAQDIRNIATIGIILERSRKKEYDYVLKSDIPAWNAGSSESGMAVQPKNHYKARINIVKSRRGTLGTVFGYIEAPNPAFISINEPPDEEINNWTFINYQKPNRR